jgi:hypothetical protein
MKLPYGSILPQKMENRKVEVEARWVVRIHGM